MDGAPCPGLPKPQHLVRAANRLRQRLGPADPVDLEFDLDANHITPPFLKAEVNVRSRHHIVYATDQQLHA